MGLTTVDYIRCYDELKRELQWPISKERRAVVLEDMKVIKEKLKTMGIVIL